MFYDEKEDMELMDTDMVEIIPLKDFVIHHNEYHIELIEGEAIEVPAKFLQNLKTEKII